jgi:hypothetical protein
VRGPELPTRVRKALAMRARELAFSEAVRCMTDARVYPKDAPYATEDKARAWADGFNTAVRVIGGRLRELRP